MADSGKRKASHRAEGDGSFKKKKKGNRGQWQTPKNEGSTKPKANSIEPGDIGIWVTCPLHMKGKAAREMELLFDDYAEKIYGIKPEEGPADGSDEEEGDIESAIQKEVGSLKDRKKNSSDRSSNRIFTEVRISQECLLFMRCKDPIEPVEFSRRICQDAATVGHGGAQARYLNRLTPLSVIVKATEGGLEEGVSKALAGHFKLKPKEAGSGLDAAGDQGRAEGAEVGDQKTPPATYAIRPSIRNHNTLKRDDVIKRIASMVDPQHKVNLGAPDKVIIVDIFQTICGLSVVPGDWDALKKYNLFELYKQAGSAKKNAEGNPETADTETGDTEKCTENKDDSNTTAQNEVAS